MSSRTGRDRGDAPWTRPGARPRRGRAPLDHARVVDAALAIADEHGLDAVSMRRLAQELGVGAMTLYSYVEDKDELLELMADQIVGEFVVPELPADWRDALRAIARRTRTAMLRHHWLIAALAAGHPRPRRIGPNALRHFEQSLQAVAALDIEDARLFELINAVDSFVVGSVLDEVEEWRESRDPADELGHLRELIESGDFPLLARTFEARGERPDPETRFERGLEWLLAGVAAELDPRG